MSTYIVQGRWTIEAVKGMLAHPECLSGNILNRLSHL